MGAADTAAGNSGRAAGFGRSGPRQLYLASPYMAAASANAVIVAWKPLEEPAGV